MSNSEDVVDDNCYSERFVQDMNSNSKSLTVMFWDLVMPSMDGESKRTSVLSTEMDFSEQFNNSNTDSAVSFLMCWYFVQWNRKCSAVSLSEPHSQIGLVEMSVNSMAIIFQHGIMQKRPDIWDSNITIIWKLSFSCEIWNYIVSSLYRAMWSYSQFHCQDLSEMSVATSNAAGHDILPGADVSPLSSWCAITLARLSAVLLPSNLECPSIFTSLMSTERLESCWWSETRVLIRGCMPVESQ